MFFDRGYDTLKSVARGSFFREFLVLSEKFVKTYLFGISHITLLFLPSGTAQTIPKYLSILSYHSLKVNLRELCYNSFMYLTIDIGGTKTLLALFSPHGLCLKRLKFPTDPSPAAYTKSLHEHLRAFLPHDFCRRHIRAITVAIPGVVKIGPNSCSFKFGNLNWPSIDLITPIKKLFNAKIFFANDANLATLYEATRPGRKNGKSIYLTFSTGVGGGIAKDGKLLKSSDAFEPGHVKYTFNRATKEWEDLASAKALIEAYQIPALQDLVLDDIHLKDLIARLSLGLLDIIDQESPETIIIGGPLAFLFKKFKKPLLASLKNSVQAEHLKLKKARRPTESVIYGAYLYSKQNYRK